MAHWKPLYVFAGGISQPPVFFEGINRRRLPNAERQYRQYQAMDGTKLQPPEKHISRHLDEKNVDAVHVLRFYDGWPGSRVVKGLDDGIRQKNGKAAGIIVVAFPRRFSAAQ